MTAQISEVLIVGGSRRALRACPLEYFFQVGGLRPNLRPASTALWRRYVGTWEIVDDRLYLVGLRGTLADGAPLSLADVFPGYPDRVFAHWFHGRLNVPQGRIVEYVHLGFASRYEREEFMFFEAGVRLRTSVKCNGASRISAPGRTSYFRRRT